MKAKKRDAEAALSELTDTIIKKAKSLGITYVPTATPGGDVEADVHFVKAFAEGDVSALVDYMRSMSKEELLDFNVDLCMVSPNI